METLCLLHFTYAYVQVSTFMVTPANVPKLSLEQKSAAPRLHINHDTLIPLLRKSFSVLWSHHSLTKSCLKGTVTKPAPTPKLSGIITLAGGGLIKAFPQWSIHE